MKFLRLYEDEAGDSHFDWIEFPMMLIHAAQPAKPSYFSQPMPADSWSSVRRMPDWDGGLHAAPQRQIFDLPESPHDHQPGDTDGKILDLSWSLVLWLSLRRMGGAVECGGHSLFSPTLSGLGHRGEESAPSIDL
jgi:hypothetical protein